MREDLQKLDKSKRYRFQGTVVGFGGMTNSFNPYSPIEETILLKDIYLLDSDGGLDKIITDHLWFRRTLGFQRIDAQPEDVIQFEARVADYYKKDSMYPIHSLEKDCCLSRPTRLVNLSRPEAKVEVLTYEAQVKKWEEKRKSRKILSATEPQINYIKAICSYLKIESPLTEDLTIEMAQKWIEGIFKQYPDLKERMRKARHQERKHKTADRNEMIYKLINSKENTVEEVAESYHLAISTIKAIYRQQERLRGVVK